MLYTTLALPLALAGLVAAAPAKRSIFARNNDNNYDDATILNYALT